ncbi:hypothetical protein [Pseudomonas mucidolens]|uniref:hypothetical protein n=1 Tax=Pseudomonas mucidolens TaxID=46679 RepID=UPI001560143C|nr:hypothetical protein [Pseudomonas mucidolens]
MPVFANEIGWYPIAYVELIATGHQCLVDKNGSSIQKRSIGIYGLFDLSVCFLGGGNSWSGTLISAARASYIDADL